MPVTIAIVGSGPAGYYTAEAAQKQWGDDVQVDIFDRMPVPYGLIRTGVAPDHQSIKGVSRRYEKTALSENIRFVGNVAIGTDIDISKLRELYDAVILATGAPDDRRLGLAGEELHNVFGSAAFVGWYNGHPAFAGLDPDLSVRNAVIIGMGNVALDVARILAKSEAEFAGSDIVGHALDRLKASRVERITILGRRGPHAIAMTPKELGELGQLERARPVVDPADLPPEGSDDALEPGQKKSVTLIRQFAEAEADRKKSDIEIVFDFFASPAEIVGNGKVSGVRIERTAFAGGRLVGTGNFYSIPADLVISCIGYRTAPIEGVPFDDRMGRFDNDEGRISPGLYCVGWARRGPTGTIGTNRPDGYAIIGKIAADLGSGELPKAGKPGRPGFDLFAADTGLDIVTFRDWQRIEQAEEAAARDGSPREKFVDIADMIAARD
ncbi:FAD-dependent oxidoreductase [Altererythrobacter sp. SALINAS58]|uniref:FAD-dependent oxidoreductase n=1 Tax=Alteripontixanthobacter muriae TaxID=2705546 RepID=UPI001576A489|nr:FAD-dependent oxidoreductase [Alteripontixanthobacter muriae]NTZ43046.1 FAD-dependent oxidoreductase [Alteripontixanthobacter muriae]